MIDAAAQVHGDARPTITPWRLARWVWGQMRARAILEGRRDGPDVWFGRSSDGCAQIAEIGRLGCRVQTSGFGGIAAAEGVAARLDEDAVLVHCRVTGALDGETGRALAAVITAAETDQAPPERLAPQRYIVAESDTARNGRPRLYDPRVDQAHVALQPWDPRATADSPWHFRRAPRFAAPDGPYVRVTVTPSDLEVLDAEADRARFDAGLAALTDLLADQPLKRWWVKPSEE